MSHEIEVFADVVCPFTHVGLRRLVVERDRRDRGGVLLRVRAWPLELVNGAPPAAELLAEEVAALREQVAPELFAGFDPAAVPVSTLPALALGLAAYDDDPARGEAVALALRHAFFEEGRRIGDRDVLVALATDHGLDPSVIDDHDRVRADFEEGRRRGVIGSPHFFAPSGVGGDDGYFCPGLEISRDDSGFHVAFAGDNFEAFAARCFT